MKVLFITPELANGGIATYCQNIWRKLAQSGVEVYVATTDKVAQSSGSVILLRQESLNKNDQLFDSLTVFPLLKNNLASAWSLFEETIEKIQPDLIEVSEFPLLFVPWILGQSNIPVLVQLHGSLGQVEYWESRHGQQVQTTVIRQIENQIIRQAEEVVALSKANAKYWTQSLGREVLTIPPPFPKTISHTNAEYAAGGVVMGRVQTWKGPEELCQAAALLGDHCPPIEWIGGDNYYREYSVSMAGYLKSKYPAWGSKIIHTGRIPYEEAQQKLAAAKFLVVPSLWDTFNFTVVEGMARGTVVICSDGAGASEHIIDGENGFVYPAKDVAALAEKIRIADTLSSEERGRIGANARITTERIFASEEPVKQRIQLYEELIKKGPSPKDDPELDWLRDWLSPNGKGSQYFPDVLLDQLSLKWLGKYMFNRVKKKFF